MPSYHIEDSGNARFFDYQENTISGVNENGNITDVELTDLLVFVIQLGRYAAGACNKTTDSEAVYLQFNKDGEGWTTVGSATEIAYASSGTTLSDGSATPDRITAGTMTDGFAAACGNGWQAGEEDTNNAVTMSVAANYYSDIAFGLDFSNATPGSTYTFRLVNGTNGDTALTQLTALPSVTMYVLGDLDIGDGGTLYDSVGVDDDTLDLALELVPNVYDEVSLDDDTVDLAFELVPNVYTDVNVEDAPTVEVQDKAPFEIDVYDEVSLDDDTLDLAFELVPNVFDSISVNAEDGVTVSVPEAAVDLDIDVYDEPSIEEWTDLAFELVPSVYDGVTVDEDVTVEVEAAAGDFEVDVYDEVTVDEAVWRETPDWARVNHVWNWVNADTDAGTVRNAFDGSTSSYWSIGYEAGWAPAYASQELVQAYTIKQLRVYSSGAYTRDPKSFDVVVSNTGAFAGEEVTLLSVTNQTGWSGEWREWDIDNNTAYRYWRFLLTAGNNTAYCRTYEVEIHAPKSEIINVGTDLAPSATLTAFSGQASVYNLVDGNTETYWATAHYAVSGTLEVTFPEAYKIRQIAWRVWNNNVTRMCHQFTLEASTTGAWGGEEVTLLTVDTSLPTWRASEWRTFQFDNDTAYQYYRFNPVATDNADYMYIAGLQMMEEGCAIDTYDEITVTEDVAVEVEPECCDILYDAFESGDFSRWTSNSGGVITTTDPFSGVYCADLSSEGDLIYFQGAYSDEWWVSYRWKPAAGWTGTEASCMAFRDHTTLGTIGIEIFKYAGNNKIYAYNGSQSLLAVSASGVLHSGWNKLDVYVKVHSTSGRVVVKHDDVTVIDFTGDTYLIKPSYDRVMFGQTGVWGNSDSFCYLDEICLSQVCWPDNYLYPSVYDSVTVDEDVTVSVPGLPLDISVYDELSVDEFLNTYPDTYARITHVVAEVLRDGDPSARITHVVAEVLRSTDEIYTFTYEAVTTEEDVTVVISVGYSPSVSDSITVDEWSELALQLVPDVYTEISITENFTVGLISFVNVYDSVSIDEYVALAWESFISVYEDVTTEESTTAITSEPVAVTDPFDDYDGDGTFDQDTNVRFIIPAAEVDGSGTQVSIRLAARGTTWSFASFYIGHPASSGDVYDFDGNQVEVTFDGGQSGATITGAGKTSDIINFNLDASKDLIFAFFFDTTSQVPTKSATSDFDLYYKVGSDESYITDVSSYTQHPTYYLRRFFSTIYVESQTSGGEYFISVADESALAESYEVAPELVTAVYDSIAVDEYIDKVLESFISVYDEVTVEEYLDELLELYIDTYEEVTVDESVDLAPELVISVYDEVTTSEYNPVIVEEVGESYISVGDDISVDESVSVDVPASINVYDSVTIEESVDVAPELKISVYDSVSLDEYTEVAFQIIISVYDSISVDEYTDKVYELMYVSAYDSVSVDEDSTVLVGIAEEQSLSTYDDISVDENIAVDIPVFINVYDEITVDEYVKSETEINPSVYDSITVDEYVAADEGISTDVYSLITVGESIIVIVGIHASVYDEITVGEYSRVFIVNPGMYLVDFVLVDEDISITISYPEVFWLTPHEDVSVEDVATVYVSGVYGTLIVDDIVLVLGEISVDERAPKTEVNLSKQGISVELL